MANSYLTLSGTAGGSTTKFTKSFWLKRSSLTQGYITDNSGTDEVGMYFNSSDKLICFIWDGSAYSTELITTRVFRDTSAWYHIVFAVDYTNSTQAQRARVYVNGEEITSFTTTTRPGNNSTTFDTYNSSKTHYIGRTSGGSHYFDGYISHLVHVDGQQLSPTSFGETDSTSGIWKFKSPSGVSFGTKGYHLKFENSGNLGLDSSGQTNNFTVNGNLKQSLDTPSNNHATFNPIDKGKTGDMNFANGNTTTMNTSGFGDYGVRSSLGVTKGKWYWEIKIGSTTSQNAFAIQPMDVNLKFDMFGSTPEAHLYGLQRQTDSATNFYSNTTFTSGNTAWGGGITSSDVIGFALDMDNGKLYISKNGTFKDLSGNTSNIGSGTYPTFTIANTSFTYALYVEMRTNDDNGLHINMGDGFFGTTAISSAGSNGNGSLFEYDVPSGFYALNTKNLNTYG